MLHRTAFLQDFFAPVGLASAIAGLLFMSAIAFGWRLSIPRRRERLLLPLLPAAAG